MVTGFQRALKTAKRRRRPAPVRPSRATELWYKGELVGLTNDLIAEVEERLLPLLEESRLFTSDAGIMARIQAVFERLEGKFSRITKARAIKIANKVVQKVDKDVSTRLESSLKLAIGLDIAKLLKRTTKLGRVVDSAVQGNVALIKSIPEQYLARIKQTVHAAVSGGMRWEKVRDAIQNSGLVTKSRAKLIARDQVSKMNGSITRIRQQDLGITSYRWSTSGDERVRSSHAELDGKVFRWDNPPTETGHPGEDYQCRCVAIAILNFDGEDTDV